MLMEQGLIPLEVLGIPCQLGRCNPVAAISHKTVRIQISQGYVMWPMLLHLDVRKLPCSLWPPAAFPVPAAADT